MSKALFIRQSLTFEQKCAKQDLERDFRHQFPDPDLIGYKIWLTNRKKRIRKHVAKIMQLRKLSA